ncbi:hypothetical protein FRAHR75_160082 [Frankia sp. Hr75.2]|nr:hypothetical protein FRAHR75_160082 [Frankia sp. Hr75.2]
MRVAHARDTSDGSRARRGAALSGDSRKWYRSVTVVRL